MNTRITLFFLVALLPFSWTFGQTEIDALRFSQFTSTGTARSLALGGGTSAMGADLSAATLNPAGLGLYRKSEFSISPTLRLVGNKADYLGETSSANRSNFAFASMGIALFNQLHTYKNRKRVPKEDGLKSLTFAFGFNQLENYYRETKASGFNSLSSITDNFAQQASGIPSETFLPFGLNELTWSTYLINPIFGANNQYYGAVDSGRVNQSQRITEKGRRNEWFLSMGANIDDFLYLGATLGIESLRYSQESIYEEDDVQNIHNFEDNDPNSDLEYPFNSLKLIEKVETSGTGINAKLGMIVRPSDNLRIGLSFHTPSFIPMTDDFSIEAEHNFSINDGLGGAKDTLVANTTGELQYLYNISTPYRASFSAMYLFGKRGFLTADVEMVDYSLSKFTSGYLEDDVNYYDYQLENDRIKDIFKTAVNLRLGGEIRLDIYRIRAGGALYGSPLTEEATQYEDYLNPGNTLTINPNRRLLTFGFGVRQPNYYIDVAYINQQTKDKINPYVTEATEIFDPTLVNTTQNNSIVLSLGFKF